LAMCIAGRLEALSFVTYHTNAPCVYFLISVINISIASGTLPTSL
jgi:hypothetical protein